MSQKVPSPARLSKPCSSPPKSKANLSPPMSPPTHAPELQKPHATHPSGGEGGRGSSDFPTPSRDPNFCHTSSHSPWAPMTDRDMNTAPPCRAPRD
ncbi:hypothetical protein LY78DRAFT_663186, partial [Colletotrichum sublineola]